MRKRLSREITLQTFFSYLFWGSTEAGNGGQVMRNLNILHEEDADQSHFWEISGGTDLIQFPRPTYVDWGLKYTKKIWYSD